MVKKRSAAIVAVRSILPDMPNIVDNDGSSVDLSINPQILHNRKKTISLINVGMYGALIAPRHDIPEKAHTLRHRPQCC